MAQKMNVRLLGFVENMSYVLCPDCGKRIDLYGKGQTEKLAAEWNCPVLATLPIDPALSACIDEGKLEEKDLSFFAPACEALQKMLQ